MSAQLHDLVRSAQPVLQRKCGTGCRCDGCSAKRGRLQRLAVASRVVDGVPDEVHSVLRSPGAPLDAATNAEMSSRFGHDFSTVRVHADAHAAASARAVAAQAYTVGTDVVFAANRYAPASGSGRQLLAHELAHVVQQAGTGGGAGVRAGPESPALEADADRAAHAALSGRPATVTRAAGAALQRRAAPYIKKVTVHLAPPQSADLEWEGTPPADATGLDHFTVSTGKGYGDPDDPPGTCSRQCCGDAMTQCAPPWNQPSRVGACCTYHGNNFWTGTPEASHNGWNWWTPIQPWYSSRGIALHQHTEVTGQPIGHGCVRMDDANAQRIHDYSNGRRTNVTVDGRAAPVACDASRRCGATGAGSGSAAGSATADAGGAHESSGTVPAMDAVPGLEGELT